MLQAADFTHSPDVDDPTQAWRFRNAPNSLQYTLIHLTGDFPLIDYTLVGRVLCFLIVILAVAVQAIPSGLMASAFTEVLLEERKSHQRKRYNAAVRIQSQIRGRLARWRFLTVADELTEGGQVESKVRASLRKTNLTAEEVSQQKARREGRKREVLDIIRSPAFRTGMMVLIVLNIIAVMLESDPHFEAAIGLNYFDGFETLSIVVLSH